jgi:hypothetical protein
MTFVNDHRQKLDADVDLKLHSTDYDVAQVENSDYNAEYDQRDMRRLGKHQELKVRRCKCQRRKRTSLTNSLQAPIPILQHRRLHHRPRAHVGILHRDFGLLPS